MIFLSFGASAHKLEKSECDDIFNKVKTGINWIEKNKNQIGKEYRKARDGYRELITQWSTVYSSFCKD